MSIANLRSLFTLSAIVTVTYATLPAQEQENAPPFDVVISGGTVIDPETQLEAVRNVAIADGRIAAISQQPLHAKRTIDANGLVVAPGFIDLHAHGQDLDNSRFQVADGVTSALEMEIGVGDIDAYYAGRAGESLNNYGATIGHVPTRIKLYDDPTESLVPRGPGANRVATPDEIQQIANSIAQGLSRGAVGVGFGLQYTPAATRDEVHAMFRVAAEHGAACFVHIRHFGPKPPAGGINALEEVFTAAALTGASLHVVHINSSGTSAATLMLRMIDDVRSRGFDVTTECYPYIAGMTAIDSALFAGNWRDALDIDYGDLQWVATGERLTESNLQKISPTRRVSDSLSKHPTGRRRRRQSSAHHHRQRRPLRRTQRPPTHRRHLLQDSPPLRPRTENADPHRSHS